MEDLLKNPIYATGIGLLMYGKDQVAQFQPAVRNDRWARVSNGESLITRMRGWLQNSF